MTIFSSTLKTKNFMKKLIPFLFLIPFIITSCDIQYNGEVRLQFKGKIVNEFNQPIENQSVKIFANHEDNYGETNMIGFGKSDSNGNYSILIPEANNFHHYDIEINETPQQNSQLTATNFIKIKGNNFVNYSLQLPNAKLYLKTNLANLNLTFTKINSSNELKSVEFIGEIANESIEFNNEFVLSEYLKKVKKNQTIEIKYKVLNHTNQTISTNSSFIIIDNSDTINHAINY